MSEVPVFIRDSITKEEAREIAEESRRIRYEMQKDIDRCGFWG